MEYFNNDFGNQARDNVLKFLLDNETGHQIEITSNEGTSTIKLLSKSGNVLSEQELNTGEGIKSASLDLENNRIVLTTFNDSHIYCDITELMDKIDKIDKKIEGMELNKVEDRLYDAYFNKLDYPFAYEYFKNQSLNINAGCTALVKNNIFARNFDFIYNEAAQFIVKTPAINNRYATMGICAGIDKLTDEFIAVNKQDEIYKIIPFAIVDGINEHGLTATVNVVPNDKGNTEASTPDVQTKLTICNSMLIRYMLDHFKTAKEAAEYVRDYVSVYNSRTTSEMKYEAHFMISDGKDTYIIEFTHNHNVITKIDVELDNNTALILSNFYYSDVTLNPAGEPYPGITYYPAINDEEHNAFKTNNVSLIGSGLERFAIARQIYNTQSTPEAILNKMTTDLKYTNAYTGGTEIGEWYTEFVGINNLTVESNPEDFTEALEDAQYKYQNRSRDPESEFYGTWHTVHTSIYDIENKTLKLVVQEEDNVLDYSFKDLITYDTALSLNSENAVQNKVITSEINIINSILNDKENKIYIGDGEPSENPEIPGNRRLYIDSTNKTIYYRDTQTDPWTFASNIKLGDYQSEGEYEGQICFYADDDIHTNDPYIWNLDKWQHLNTNTIHIKGTDPTSILSYQVGDIWVNKYTKSVFILSILPETGGLEEWIPMTPIIDNVQSTDSKSALSANMGRELQEEIDNLKARGRFLSLWNCITGLPETDPIEDPYYYKAGDYYIIGTVGSADTEDPYYIYDTTFENIQNPSYDERRIKNALYYYKDYDFFNSVKYLTFDITINESYFYEWGTGRPIDHIDLQTLREYGMLPGSSLTALDKNNNILRYLADDTTAPFIDGTINRSDIGKSVKFRAELVPNRNHRPEGSYYTKGSRSYEEELEEVNIDDVYYYDGQNWSLQVNTRKELSFANITGQPLDNANLSAEFSKYVKSTDYATESKAGTIKLSMTQSGTYIDSSGTIFAKLDLYDIYKLRGDGFFISKGTLENVIAGKELVNSDQVDTKINEAKSSLIKGAQIRKASDEVPIGTLWQDIPIVDGKVQVPTATGSTSGTVRAAKSYGVSMLGVYLQTAKASNGEIDSRSQDYTPIVPSNLDYAVKSALQALSGFTTNKEQILSHNASGDLVWIDKNN